MFTRNSLWQELEHSGAMDFRMKDYVNGSNNLDCFLPNLYLSLDLGEDDPPNPGALIGLKGLQCRQGRSAQCRLFNEGSGV